MRLLPRTGIMNFILRAGTSYDAPSCAQIIGDWSREIDWMMPLIINPPVVEAWQYLIASDTAWVAECNGQVVGFCVREVDNITGLYVAREARNLGIGKALLDVAKKDRDWITVWAYERNDLARRFYRREGLQEVSRETEVFADGTELVDVEHIWVKQDSKKSYGC